ncbi:MAG: hypothetical protein V3U73_11080, partial [bacterium]
MKPSQSDDLSDNVGGSRTTYESFIHFWKPILVTLLGIFGVSALLLHSFSELRELILFGLYSTFSHFLISFFPHEPALLYYAKFYSPLSIALVSTIGCCLAGLFDYWFL